MNHTEAAALLAVCSAFDNREANPQAIHAWQAALPTIAFEDAKDAVIEHYSHQTAWIMPAHVRELVRVAGNRRYDEAQHEDLKAITTGDQRNLAPNQDWLEQQRAKRKIRATPSLAYAEAVAAMDEMLAKKPPEAATP
jgi:hypothetical protein